jgi:uncharacterized membrane protein
MFRYGNHAHHPFVGILFLVLVAALLVLGVIVLVRMLRNPPGPTALSQTGTASGSPVDPALNELRIRYARGDINWDEYSQRAGNLGYPLPGPGSPAGQAPPPVA